jgi:flagellin-like hook-associated protein FlgL
MHIISDLTTELAQRVNGLTAYIRNAADLMSLLDTESKLLSQPALAGRT